MGALTIIPSPFSSLASPSKPVGSSPSRDSIILAAACSSGARELLTEDLNQGQDYDGARVVIPFR